MYHNHTTTMKSINKPKKDSRTKEKARIRDFIFPVAAKIIVNIRDCRSVSDMFRKTEYTLSHSVRILKMLDQEGFVRTEKIGRIRSVELTKKGNELIDILSDLERVTK